MDTSMLQTIEDYMNLMRKRNSLPESRLAVRQWRSKVWGNISDYHTEVYFLSCTGPKALMAIAHRCKSCDEGYCLSMRKALKELLVLLHDTGYNP